MSPCATHRVSGLRGSRRLGRPALVPALSHLLSDGIHFALVGPEHEDHTRCKPRSYGCDNCFPAAAPRPCPANPSGDSRSSAECVPPRLVLRLRACPAAERSQLPRPRPVGFGRFRITHAPNGPVRSVPRHPLPLTGPPLPLGQKDRAKASLCSCMPGTPAPSQRMLPPPAPLCRIRAITPRTGIFGPVPSPARVTSRRSAPSSARGTATARCCPEAGSSPNGSPSRWHTGPCRSCSRSPRESPCRT